jgi:RecA/RadA recombinase
MANLLDKLRTRDAEEKKKIKEKMGRDLTNYMGDPALNWGVGGWARAATNLVWGPSGSGKTTVALKAAADEQKKTRGLVYIFDSEYNHNDPDELDDDGKRTAKAEKCRQRYISAGLDPSKVYVRSKNRVDDLFADLPDLEAMLKEDPTQISAIIVDSWGGIQSEQAAKKLEKGKVAEAGNAFGGNAKTTGPILQTLLRLAAEYGVTMFFVQHAMKNMEEYGPRYIMLGGEKLKYLVDTCVFFEAVQSKTAALLEDGTISEDYEYMYKVGKLIRFRCDKSRNLVEGRKAEFYMNFETCEFAVPHYSLYNLATGLGIIGKVKDKKKGWYEYPVGAPTPAQFYGEPKVIAELGSDVNFFNSVYQDCLASKKTSTVEDPVGNEKEEQKDTESSKSKKKKKEG